ncbi:hypothetical protein N7475_004310 [Penicillium sp. IBT 31633x]|nr:hypothetical protein N7475_004310 [Penicillium sp. IBT 31633x]
MHCHPVLQVAVLVSVSFGNPVPSSKAKLAPDVPDILTEVLNKAANFSNDISYELSQLEVKISDITTGKINPVSTIEKCLSTLSSISSNRNKTILQKAIDVVSVGLVSTSTIDILNGVTNHEINSVTNNNTKNPVPPIYPTKFPADAPYNIPETALRGAIYIPPSFSYGITNKTPVVLIPGTADPAGSTFFFNYAKLFTENPHTDPVWVNIPGTSRGDIQSNAEYVAYAINYIAAVSQGAIGVLAWSQGSVDVQWALKYWPPTREAVSNFLVVSGDFHGTVVEMLCGLAEWVCPPSVLQQGYAARFIRALRGEDGDSAYVPTTKRGLASGALGDVRGVGVSNVQVQIVCAGRPAGGLYSHSATLVNPLAYALFVDALAHDGPGRLERVDLDAVCGQSFAPGLDLGDVLGMETVSNVVGVLDVLLYGFSWNGEPPLREYVHR